MRIDLLDVLAPQTYEGSMGDGAPWGTGKTRLMFSLVLHPGMEMVTVGSRKNEEGSPFFFFKGQSGPKRSSPQCVAGNHLAFPARGRKRWMPAKVRGHDGSRMHGHNQVHRTHTAPDSV